MNDEKHSRSSSEHTSSCFDTEVKVYKELEAAYGSAETNGKLYSYLAANQFMPIAHIQTL